MMKLLVIIAFAIVSAWNVFVGNKNIIRVKRRKIYYVLLAISALIFIYLCYRFDNTFLGYLIVFMSCVLLYTVMYSPGIYRDGMVLFLGSSFILRRVKFDKIKKVEFFKKDVNDLELEISAFDTSYSQIYDIKDEEKVSRLLDSRIGNKVLR